MDLASLFESSVVAETIPFDFVDRTELIRLQQSDPGLSSLFALVDKGDDHYLIKSSVLLRTWRDKLAPPESSIHQIVVPVSVRPKLLQIAHEIPAAGHLGVAKTQTRLLHHFCWPSISRDTKSFCHSCDICHRLGKGNKPVLASIPADVLVQSPVIDDPALTSLPSSVPVVKTLLSKADDQLTSTQTEGLTAFNGA